ncbi:MAG: BtpA/SgcQ family protein [bacterium]|nr:BtpA/SgcQ family protein [bacterium]
MKAPAQPGVLPARKSIVGMIHVGALPGTPHNADSVSAIANRAAEEARLLEGAGLDAVMIENMHDRPYLLREVGPEIVAGMTAVAAEVRRAVELPLGVQILAGANAAALAVAHASGAAFVRVEGFVFGHLADEGLMDRADAAPLLRYRRQIGAEQIAVWADVKKKHASHAISADVDLAETARAAEFFGADAVIVTGTATGRPAAPADVRRVKQAVDLPVAIGSGLSPDNLAEYWNHADIFIIGSAFKHDGLWSNPPDPTRLQQLAEAVAALRA